MNTANSSPCPLSYVSLVLGGSTSTSNRTGERPQCTESSATLTQGAGRDDRDGGALHGGIQGGNFTGGTNMWVRGVYILHTWKDNLRGKLKDPIKIYMGKYIQGSQWKVVCVKATNHELSPPKGKHVMHILRGLRIGGDISRRNNPIGAVFYHLRKRMTSNDWIVVLKAQTIFHHLFRDGNPRFADRVANNIKSLFLIEFPWDDSNESYHIMHFSLFIRSDGAYIEQ